MSNIKISQLNNTDSLENFYVPGTKETNNTLVEDKQVNNQTFGSVIASNNEIITIYNTKKIYKKK